MTDVSLTKHKTIVGAAGFACGFTSHAQAKRVEDMINAAVVAEYERCLKVTGRHPALAAARPANAATRVRR